MRDALRAAREATAAPLTRDRLWLSAAFLYLFVIGRRLGGPMCGLAAVLLLFVYRPLLFVAALFLPAVRATALLPRQADRAWQARWWRMCLLCR